MIQDIFPHKLDNSFNPAAPEAGDPVICFENDGIWLSYDETKNTIDFPKVSDFAQNLAQKSEFDPNTNPVTAPESNTEPQTPALTYLFSLDDTRFFIKKDPIKELPPYKLYSMKEIRKLKVFDKHMVFAAFTAYHLAKWYEDNRFCGRCGGSLKDADDERALICPDCGNRIYPRINPAVIIAVTKGDKLLITRYRTGYSHNALVAGFTEIGESLEETVQREVKEEVGLSVKNIRYYKSQPWGVAQDILVGFFCEVDGDDEITMDESELKYAEWLTRDEIELQPSEYSLTNEMMKVFKDRGE